MPVICVDTSQAVIKKLFDAVAGDVSSSSSPSPPGPCLFSVMREFVGGGRGIMGETLTTELPIHCLFFYCCCFLPCLLVFLLYLHSSLRLWFFCLLLESVCLSLTLAPDNYSSTSCSSPTEIHLSSLQKPLLPPPPLTGLVSSLF